MADLVGMWFGEQVKPEILSSPQPELKKKKSCLQKMLSEHLVYLCSLIRRCLHVMHTGLLMFYLGLGDTSVSRSWQKKIVINISLLIFVYLAACFASACSFSPRLPSVLLLNSILSWLLNKPGFRPRWLQLSMCGLFAMAVFPVVWVTPCTYH